MPLRHEGDMRPTDYRIFLRQEYERRLARNPRLSMRGFAKHLGLTPSRMSDILMGKQGISRTAAQEVARRLGLPEKESEWWVALVESQHARSRVARELASEKLKSFEKNPQMRLSLEVFRAVSDWYHFALVELTRVPGFRSDLNWISKRLKISKIEAKEAVGRLLQVGLLLEENNVWRAAEGFVFSGGEIPSEAVREYHKQILSRASLALSDCDFDERDFSAMNFTISREHLPEAKKKIRAFRRKFVKYFEDLGGGDQVHCLSVQLFPVDQK